MSLSETHQPKTKGATTKPSVFVDGASGTTGLGIADRLRLQSDIAVKPFISGTVNLTHAGFRQFLQDVILTNSCSNHGIPFAPPADRFVVGWR